MKSDSQSNMNLNRKIENMLNQIPCDDSETIYEDSLGKFNPHIGTHTIASQQFIDWLEGRESRIWCHGMREYQ